MSDKLIVERELIKTSEGRNLIKEQIKDLENIIFPDKYKDVSKKARESFNRLAYLSDPITSENFFEDLMRQEFVYPLAFY